MVVGTGDNAASRRRVSVDLSFAYTRFRKLVACSFRSTLLITISSRALAAWLVGHMCCRGGDCRL